jgi:hypothetical protein
MKFKEVKLKEWKGIHQYSKHGWLYRGHREADWELESSFERCCKRHQVHADCRRELEKRLFREFRRTYPLYAKHIPHPGSVIEWLSLMQHHGAPTRLLDFTYSIYVAAYFATEEEAKEDSAIWAIQGQWAKERACKLLKKAGKRGSGLRLLETGKQFEEKDEKPVSALFFKTPYVRLCWPINGFRLNERLLIQRGVFLVPGDVSCSFMLNIIPLMERGVEDRILKIVIPKKVGRQAVAELFSMGISRTSLFPGLDGFSRSLGVWHSAFDPAYPTCGHAPRRVAGAPP